MGFLRWLIGLVITIVIASFAAMNTEVVSFTFSPVHDPVSIPVYMVILSTLAFGFLFGGIVVWLNAAPVRKAKRKQKKEIKLLEKELEKLKSEAAVRDHVQDLDVLPAQSA